LHLIALGLFKQVYVAENLAPYLDHVFSSGNPTGREVLFGGRGFAIQVYGDFSGYFDIAPGCAKCLGIDLSNKNIPN
jgi:alginate O-acetyltransferase complex protein AlgI